MATGTRAGMWDPWNDGTAALSLRAAPCTLAPPGHSLMFSAISSCFSSRPSGITFISRMPQRAVSHPGEWGNAVEARGGKAGCRQHSLPAALQIVPSLGTYISHPCPHLWEDPGGSWQKPSGWSNHAAPSYVASLPCEDEGAVQIPALTILSGCAMPQRLWHEGSRRDLTTFLTLTSNKTSLQRVVWLNHKGQNVSCTCWQRYYLNPQLHAHTFALIDYRYTQINSVSSFRRVTKVTLWVKELDHPPLSLLSRPQRKHLSLSSHLIKIWFIHFKLSKHTL